MHHRPVYVQDRNVNAKHNDVAVKHIRLVGLLIHPIIVSIRCTNSYMVFEMFIIPSGVPQIGSACREGMFRSSLHHLQDNMSEF